MNKWIFLATVVWAAQFATAQQAADRGQPPAPKSEIATDADALKLAEQSHPGNTAEVAAALHAMIQAELEEEEVDDATLARAQRERAVAAAALGTESVASLEAIDDTAQVLNGLDRAAEARPLAEQALETAEKLFPDSGVAMYANTTLAEICRTLGDYKTGLSASGKAIEVGRKAKAGNEEILIEALTAHAELRVLTHDGAGAVADMEEALEVARGAKLSDIVRGTLENDAAVQYQQIADFPKAIGHYNSAVELIARAIGPQNSLLAGIQGNLADLYTRTGQFDLAWKGFQIALADPYLTSDYLAWDHFGFARSLASGGDLKRAAEEALLSARLGREKAVLQARTLPEIQALEYFKRRPLGIHVALSLLAKHPELPTEPTYEEVVRSRALVADEIARRQRNLNSTNDPHLAQQLNDLQQARNRVLEADAIKPGTEGKSKAVAEAEARMEKIERALAEHSATVRADEREDAITVKDLRASLPPGAVLVSYMAYGKVAVDKVDAEHVFTTSYIAFVLRIDSERIQVFDLGPCKTIDDLTIEMRKAVDRETKSGGLASAINERAYRDAALALRKIVWDPLAEARKGANLVLVVPDRMLNLIPFASLPAGDGYLVDHSPVIHVLSSERDLLSAAPFHRKSGLLALGGPAFDRTQTVAGSANLRGAPAICEDLNKVRFPPLPEAAAEAVDISALWKRWEGGERATVLTGTAATSEAFLRAAGQSRVLHVATHTFLMNKSCGGGNPLLDSGLVFAGVNADQGNSIVTAQQIASLDLDGVDWAVLSACNTGNGQLSDGEGVLGLERAFRIAGARSIVMTLWPVDDEMTRRYVQALYRERLEFHRSTADSAWLAARAMLAQRRAAGQSTHPWYWAGMVAAGAWQ